MASGFRWGRRPLVPRSAEPHTEPRQERAFPTAWARTNAAVAARQTILKSCLAHKVACGITTNTADELVKRVKEGWKMIRSTEGVIRDGRAALARQ